LTHPRIGTASAAFIGIFSDAQHGLAARRPVEAELHHRIGREQVSEAVDIAVQHQLAAAGQNVGGRGGWHVAVPFTWRFIQQAFI
jgi:hypothetical protein